MNKIKIYHCLNCIKNLYQHGEGVIDIYEQLCDNYIVFDCEPMIFDFDHKTNCKILGEPIAILEAEGYLLTTEYSRYSKSSIQLKPIGLYQITDDLYEFCPLNCAENQRYKNYELD